MAKCGITTFLPEVKDYTLFVQFSARCTATLLALYFGNGICYRRKTSCNRKRMNRSMTLYDEINFRLQREVGPFLKSGHILYIYVYIYISDERYTPKVQTKTI